MITVVYFDMGGVVIREAPIMAELAKRLGVPPGELIELREAHKTKLHSGELRGAEFAVLIARRYQLTADVEAAWRDVFRELIVVNQPVLDLVDRLRRRYKVGLLTNVTDVNEAVVRETGLYDHFNPCIISCRVGVSKPDPRIYQLAVGQAGVGAEQCLFLDDSRLNVDAARAFGMRAIQVTDVGMIEAELEVAGVTAPVEGNHVE